MKKNSGFSFVEIMVCVVILSTGLLGLVGLQARGLRNNVSANQRAQASLSAYNIIDRMRANVANASNAATSTYVTTTVSDTTTPDVNCQPTTVSGVPATTCNSTKMAVNDLVQWNRELTAQYCNGATTTICNGVRLGEVSYNATATAVAQASSTITPRPLVFTITISWDDNRNGIVDNRDPNDASKPCYANNTTMPTLNPVPAQFDPCFRTDFQL